VLATDSAKVLAAASGDIPKTNSIRDVMGEKEIPEPTPTSQVQRTDIREGHPASTEFQTSPSNALQSLEVRGAEIATTPTIDPAQDSVEIPNQRTLNGERYPQTRQRLLTLENIKGLSAAEVQYAINEIYARNHVRHQFQKFDWYQPKPGLTFDDIDQSMSDTERQNLKVLAQSRAMSSRP
jgi:hypothetical protein